MSASNEELRAELESLVSQGRIEEAARRIKELPKNLKLELARVIEAATPAGPGASVQGAVPEQLVDVVKASRKRKLAKDQAKASTLKGEAFSAAALDQLPFASESWDMLAAFGAGAWKQDDFRCTCAEKGQTLCPCLSLSKPLLDVSRELARDVAVAAKKLSQVDGFTYRHLVQLKRTEMLAFVKWKLARKGSEKDEGRKAEAVVQGEGEGSDDDEEAIDTELLQGFDDTPLLGAKEVETEGRLSNRVRFADERSDRMAPEQYNEFCRQRRMFFLKDRARKASKVGSAAFFRKWVGLGDKTKVAPATLQALAFLAYDHFGKAVELALGTRFQGRLVELPAGERLSAEELGDAAKRLPRHMDDRTGGKGEGLSETVLEGYREGLRWTGELGNWKESIITSKQVLGLGGKWTDIAALSEKADRLLSSE